MPTRSLGGTGVKVPILSLGGSVLQTQLLLRQAYKWGVTYWDTAHSYMGVNSEKLIGKYLLRYPQHRKEIFIVTKSYARSDDAMTSDLDQSLERMRTDYVDLFFVHGVNSIAVWEKPNIASICSEMPNMHILMENISAALNRTRLSSGDRKRLQRNGIALSKWP